jgi:hypothetical protein
LLVHCQILTGRHILANWLDRVYSLLEVPVSRLVLLIAILGLAAIIALQKLGRRSKEPVLFKKKRLLTANEVEFFHRLRQALPDYHVFPQVSMGALMSPASGVSRQEYLPVRNRFAAKIVDFVVTDDELNPIALIELDDRTHSAEKDARRDAMTGAAGYTTLRYQSRNKPAPDVIRRDLTRARKRSD